MDARTAATHAVTEVLTRGRSLGAVLEGYLQKVVPSADRALGQELAFGVLRWHPRLAALSGRLLTKPLRRKDRDIDALLLIGLYQLAYMRIPPHAAVTETVSVTQRLGKPWAAGLVNGVLRGYQRRRSELEAQADRDAASRWAHPPWLIEMIARAWPDHWQAIVTANNQHPPLSLRINPHAIQRRDYGEALHAHGIESRPIRHTEQGIVVTRPINPVTLPGFDAGWFSVQDGAAQLAAPLLDAQAGDRILDACCAPGGKTTHLLEWQPRARVLALDKDAGRMEQVRANLQRLRLHAETVVADAVTPAQWWDGHPFDRILLDAPCSASGVIRRHPDIKVLRRREDIGSLVETQRRLLHALWPLLTPGGLLLYVTCSILNAENQDQIKSFVEAHPDARPVRPEWPWGHTLDPGWQVLPGEDGMDGFYYARLIKQRP